MALFMVLEYWGWIIQLQLNKLRLIQLQLNKFDEFNCSVISDETISTAVSVFNIYELHWLLTD